MTICHLQTGCLRMSLHLLMVVLLLLLRLQMLRPLCQTGGPRLQKSCTQTQLSRASCLGS